MPPKTKTKTVEPVEPVEEPQEAPSALLEHAPAAEDGSVLIEAAEDGSVLLADDDAVTGFMEEHRDILEGLHGGHTLAEVAAELGVDLDDEPEATATCGQCGGSIELLDDGVNRWWVHDVHPEDEHDAVPSEPSLQETAAAEEAAQVDLPGSVESLSTPPFNQGDAPVQPEPVFGAPVVIRDTAEVQGAVLGVSPSPLQGPAPVVPTQVTSGMVVDTTGDTIPPGSVNHEVPDAPDGDTLAHMELDRLRNFLAYRFPAELVRTNVQQPETTVDVAIRLLTTLHATSIVVARCQENWCNKPTGHLDEHGWVN